ncbi:MAG: 5-methyltetrahydropteroyltriglutamate--homocysteine S-methyltransferase [Nakamurella sp.]
MSTATVYGYPRQGTGRELKKAIEGYWRGNVDAAGLLATGKQLRDQRRADMVSAGLDEVPVGDFSLYDHMLDASCMLGAIPPRHVAAVPDVSSDKGTLDRYFAMARGTAGEIGAVEPLEMTKWFDTNYHYLVPEIGPDTAFALDASKLLGELAEASAAGVAARPVVVGPVTYLLLAKAPQVGIDGYSDADDASRDFAPIDRLSDIVPLYVELLAQLKAAGAEWVQLDEPALVTDQPQAVLDAVEQTYAILTAATSRPKILVASYFDQLGAALPVLAASNVDGLALDFVGSAKANLDGLAAIGGLGDKRLVAGVVDGHNIWATDLASAAATLASLKGLTSQLDVAASCSLLHVPLDVQLEERLDPTVKTWFAFAKQKLTELVVLKRVLNDGPEAAAAELVANARVLESRRTSPIVVNDAVRARMAALTDADFHRAHPYADRREPQRAALHLPAVPTTTIGSFPQTTELRQARAGLRKGSVTPAEYEAAMKAEIAAVIAEQERIGVDVLVHGEPERNDMVQYFGEQLTGYVATDSGWVQSYGTRYVRPPIIVGDVLRPAPMTVKWISYAASLTDKPVKGMLTGPVTMLAWSFVRDDQPLGDTAKQVALALRDEVADLAAAGVRVIQVDEPALRETLPLRRSNWDEYLNWATHAFRLATSGVADAVQIHTHMCYAEFGDVLSAIIDLDADVISLEASRSKMEIVEELQQIGYPNEVGPGVWDIHSPRVPSVEEMTEKLTIAADSFGDRAWANPDCGLKTRGYPEVKASLENLVAAAKAVRAR